MANIGKKKLELINHISFSDDVIREYYDNFTDNNPETWDKEDKLLFDAMNELEYRIIKRVNEIIKTNLKN